MTLESRIVDVVTAIGGDVKTLTTAIAGKNPSITVKDHGTTKTTTVNSINFAGSGVSTTTSGNDVTVTVSSSGSGSGSGLTYTAIQTSNYSASVNDAVRVNSTAGSFTVTLPPTPADGSIVAVFDIVDQCATHAVLVSPSGGDKVESDSSGLSINIAGAYVALVYNSATTNWKIADTYSNATSAALSIQDHGTPIVTAPSAINFTGSGVSSSNNSGVVSVNISGGGTGAYSYVHDQSVASDTWTITHNLGSYPSVTIIDSGGSEVEGSITYTSGNVIQLVFTSPFGGTAYLN